MSAFNSIVTHTLNDERAAESPNQTVNVTRGMVRERAVELAVYDGRKPHETSKSDRESAKREMIAFQED